MDPSQQQRQAGPSYFTNAGGAGGGNSPHNQYTGFDFSGFETGGEMFNVNHSNPSLHGDLDEHLPQIYEQTESDGGFTDLNLLHDPHADVANALAFDSLALHSPTQPHAFPSYLDGGAGANGIVNPTTTNHSSPAHSPGYALPAVGVPTSNTPPHQFNTHQRRPSSSGSLHGVGGSVLDNFPPPAKLNVANLEQYLSAHSPQYGTSPELTPNSDWESSSQVSFDSVNHPSPGGPELSGGPSGGGGGGGANLRRSQSATATYADGGKSYRRNIEKKSRDKKTEAYTKLKSELEIISRKTYGQRSQAEVFEGATALLIEKETENRRLMSENELMRQRLRDFGVAL